MAVRAVGLTGPGFVPAWRSPDLPAPTIEAQVSGVPGKSGWVLDAPEPPGGPTVRPDGSSPAPPPDRGPAARREASRPPYRVPSVAEVRRLRACGLSVVSTFSGAGGSCLGFRMAGYRVLAATEFIEAARETYAANFPGVPIEPRDIREVSAADLLALAGAAAGEVDVLEGSPPCSSFSTAGKKERKWGVEAVYSDKRQRTDDLFFEFARILAGVRPRVFVAENVSGLLKGASRGYFLEIVRALREPGYVVEARLLDAQWLGVPQQRQRVIFVGVRSDLGRAPAFPDPLPYRYSVRDALQGVPAASTSDVSIEGYCLESEWRRLRQGETSDRYFNLVRAHELRPCPTVTATAGSNPGTAGVTHPTQPRKFTIAELRRLGSFPDDFVLTGSYAQQWERIGRAVPPLMMRAVALAVRDRILQP